MHRQIRVAFAMLLLVAGCGVAHADNNKAEAVRAAEVLRQAREAIGGEEKIRGVQSLTAKGKYRRVIQERDISGEREFNFLLPDKFLKSDSMIVGGLGTSVTNYRALNGNAAWSGNSHGAPNMIMMGRGGAKPTQEQLDEMEKRQVQSARAEYARYVLALLLNPPAGFDVQFAYAGEAVADDGSADVVDATGPDGFAARLFLDKQTHLPLMLSYRAPKPRVFTMMRSSKDDNKKKEDIVKEAQDKAAREMADAKPEEVEMQLRFSDYRKVNGLLLPHRITQATDGEINDEWEIKTFELNPQFKADKFQKK